ncbi:ABC transporter substrate-binding protein [Shigella flexneri]
MAQEKRNEEAKKLLAEAGYTADKPLTFSLLYNTSDLHKKLAIAVASIWKKNLGVNVKLETRNGKPSSIRVIRVPLTWHVQDGARTITNGPHSEHHAERQFEQYRTL